MLLKRLSLKFPIMVLFMCALTHSASCQQPSLVAAKGYSKIDTKVTKRVKLPRWYHEGLYWNNGEIWVANGEGGRTWVVDTETGKIKAEISSIAGFTEGIAGYGDDRYFVTDWNEKKVYVAVVKDGWFVAQKEASVAPALPAGVAWTGQKLFVIAWTRGMGTRFDLLEMDKDLNVKASIPIKRIQEPAHMAWDGRYLWITSWYSKMAYKVDPRTWQILGWFSSPASKATGICWDGSSLWITGTYSDLYKVELDNGGDDMEIKVESAAFKDGQMMPRKYTCDGDNVSPALKWSGVPAEAKSIAIVCDDPDAPRGTWTHWIRFNMPPQTVSVPEGVPCAATLPDGSVQLINDSGSQGYDGPCPPSGTHRYYFKVYALGEKLDIGPTSNKRDFFNAIKGLILAEGSTMSTYKR